MANNNIKVVCFYTPNGIYSEMANRLKKSCDALHIPTDIAQANDLGSWVKNCGYKSEFIRNKLANIEDGESILWIDSDAVVVTYPLLVVECSQDFAIHARNGSKSIRPAGRETIQLPKKWTLEPKWFESGTIFFRKTPQIVAMVELWCSLTADGNKWDQWTLQEAWAEIQPPTLWLPRSYCQINRMHGSKDAVILHDLASVIQKVNRT